MRFCWLANLSLGLEDLFYSIGNCHHEIPCRFALGNSVTLHYHHHYFWSPLGFVMEFVVHKIPGGHIFNRELNYGSCFVCHPIRMSILVGLASHDLGLAMTLVPSRQFIANNFVCKNAVLLNFGGNMMAPPFRWEWHIALLPMFSFFLSSGQIAALLVHLGCWGF